jgi:hypothetical protein
MAYDAAPGHFWRECRILGGTNTFDRKNMTEVSVSEAFEIWQKSNFR